MANPAPHPAPGTPDLDPERTELRRLKRLLEQKPLTLRDYYTIGEQLRRLSEDPAVAVRGSDWRTELANLLGPSKSTLNKALQFRMRYREKDLPEVEGLGVGWALITVALAVEDKRERHQLLRQAREEGWNGPELQRKIQQLKGSRRGGGRRRRPPKSMGLVGDVGNLTTKAKAWADFCEKLWAAGQEEAYATEVSQMAPQTRETVGSLVDEAVEELDRLQQLSAKALTGLTALRRQLKRLGGKPAQQG
jgi:hypothetical protein